MNSKVCEEQRMERLAEIAERRDEIAKRRDEIAKRLAELAKRRAELEEIAVNVHFDEVEELYYSRIQALLEKMVLRFASFGARNCNIKEMCTSAFFCNQSDEITIGFIVEVEGGIFYAVVMGDAVPYCETQTTASNHYDLMQYSGGHFDGHSSGPEPFDVELEFCIPTFTKIRHRPTTTDTSVMVQENPHGFGGIFKLAFPDTYHELMRDYQEEGEEEEAGASD
jgi:hypothetical protein